MKSLILILPLLLASVVAQAKMDCSKMDTSAFVKSGQVGGAADRTIYRFDVIRDALLDSVDQPDLMECIDAVYQKGLMDETTHWAGQLQAAGCERQPGLKIGGPNCDKNSQAYKSSQYLISLDEEVASDLGKVKRASAAAREKERAIEAAACPVKDDASDLAAATNAAACCGSPDDPKGGMIETAWPGKATDYKSCVEMTGKNTHSLARTAAGCIANALWGVLKGMWESVSSLGSLAGGAWDYVTHPGKMVGAMGKIYDYCADSKFRKLMNDKIMAAIQAYFSTQVGAFQCMNGHYRTEFMCDKGGQIIGMFATQNAIGKLLSLATKPLGMIASGIGDMMKGTKVGQALTGGAAKGAAAVKAAAAAARELRIARAAAAAARTGSKFIPGIAKTSGRWVMVGGKMVYKAGKGTVNFVGRPLTAAAEKTVSFVANRRSYKWMLDKALRFQESQGAKLESRLLANSTTVGTVGSTAVREVTTVADAEAAGAASAGGKDKKRERVQPEPTPAGVALQETRGTTDVARGSALEPSTMAQVRPALSPQLTISRNKLSGFTPAATENLSRNDALKLLGATKKDAVFVAHDLHLDIDKLAAASELTPSAANRLHDAVTEAQRVATKAKAVKAWPRLREEPIVARTAPGDPAVSEAASVATNELIFRPRPDVDFSTLQETRGTIETARGAGLEPSNIAPARASLPPRLTIARDKLSGFTRAATENMSRDDAFRLLGASKKNVEFVAHDLHKDIDALASAGEFTPAAANRLHDSITEAQRVATKAKSVKAWPRLREEPVIADVASAPVSSTTTGAANERIIRPRPQVDPSTLQETRGATEVARGAALEPSTDVAARASLPPRLTVARDKLNGFTTTATENMSRTDAYRLLGATKRDVEFVAHDLHKDIDALAAAGEYSPAAANRLHDSITEAQRVATKAKSVKAWPRLREEPVVSDVAATASSKANRKPVLPRDIRAPLENRSLVARTGSDPIDMARGAPLEPARVQPTSAELAKSKTSVDSFASKAAKVNDSAGAQALFNETNARVLRRDIEDLAASGRLSAEEALAARRELVKMERLAEGRAPLTDAEMAERLEGRSQSARKEKTAPAKVDDAAGERGAMAQTPDEPDRPFGEGVEPPARMSDAQMRSSQQYLERLDRKLRNIGSSADAQVDARRAFRSTREDKLRKEVDSLHEQIDQLAQNKKITPAVANDWHSNVSLGESYANGTNSVRTWGESPARAAGPIKFTTGEKPSPILNVASPSAPTTVFTPLERTPLLGDGVKLTSPISGNVTTQVTYSSDAPWTGPKQEIPVPGAVKELPAAGPKAEPARRPTAKGAVGETAEDVARKENASTLLDRELSGDEQVAVSNIANLCSEERGRVMSFACRVKKTWACKRAFEKGDCKKLIAAKVFGTPEGGMPAAVEAQMDSLAQVDSQSRRLQKLGKLTGTRLALYKKYLGNAMAALAKKETVPNKTITAMIAMEAAANGTATPEQTEADKNALSEDRENKINAANMAKYGPEDGKFNEALVMLNLQPDEVTAGLGSKGVTSVMMDADAVSAIKETTDGSGVKALRAIHRGFSRSKKATTGIVRSTAMPGLVKVRLGKTDKYLLGCYSEVDQSIVFKKVSTQAKGTSIDQSSGDLCDAASTGGY